MSNSLTQAQESIQRVFLEEIKKRPIQSVKVAALCRAAAVNRSTFYSYYTDVFDLYDKMVDSLYQTTLAETLDKLNNDRLGHENSTHALIEAGLDITLKHRELCEVLSRQFRGSFEETMLQMVLDCLAERYRRFICSDAEQFRMELIPTIGGVLSLWQYWVRSGFRVPKEQIVLAIEEHIRRNAKILWP